MKKDWRRGYKPWTPFERAEFPGGQRDHNITNTDEVWLNNRYQVTLRYQDHPLFGPMCHLSIKRIDRQVIHDWRDLQRIKNELLGPEVEAVELYPAESRLIDTSNQYHLWAILKSIWPIGWNEPRVVSEVLGSEIGDKSVQRPFPPDANPIDLLTPEDLERRLKEYTSRFKKGDQK